MFDGQGGPWLVSRGVPWRHLRLAKSEQPYKVARLRFNPKFISSISKGLSRCPSVSERLTCTTVLFPSTLLLSSARYPRSSLSSACEDRNASLQRILPLHYEYYIAIFIISADIGIFDIPFFLFPTLFSVFL